MTTTFACSTPAPRRVVRRVDESVYRRRRLVVGTLLAGLLALAGLAVTDTLAGPGGVPASAAGVQPTVERVTVVAQPGDTLWAIAHRYHGSVDVDRYLEALMSLNGGAGIQAGQAVTLP